MRVAWHTKPELKDMSLKIESAHSGSHIMKEKRSTPRFHITMNFWNIMDDKDFKSFQREKDDPSTKDPE